MRNLLFATVVLIEFSAPTFAADYIKCSHNGVADVSVALDITMAEAVSDGRTNPDWLRTHRWGNMSCLYGPFIIDMSACAPAKGGYGFSAPTGYAPLVDIGSRWQDVAGHSGGVFGFEISPTAIDMTGGFAGTEYRRYWSFHVERLTGSAELTTTKEWAATLKKPETQETTTYTCQKAPRKF